MISPTRLSDRQDVPWIAAVHCRKPARRCCTTTTTKASTDRGNDPGDATQDGTIAVMCLPFLRFAPALGRTNLVRR